MESAGRRIARVARHQNSACTGKVPTSAGIQIWPDLDLSRIGTTSGRSAAARCTAIVVAVVSSLRMTMTAGEPPEVSPDVLQLWTDVGNGLIKSQTGEWRRGVKSGAGFLRRIRVAAAWGSSAPSRRLPLPQPLSHAPITSTVVWRSAVDSLENAYNLYESCPEARLFCETHMAAIIGILTEQQPSKIGHMERQCVQDSLATAVLIVAKDLRLCAEQQTDCRLWDALAHALNRKKAFYKGGGANKGTSWNVSHFQGLPEVRLKMIERFRTQGRGFFWITQQTSIPPLPYLHHILVALSDLLPDAEDEAIPLAQAVMAHMQKASDDDLKRIPADHLTQTQLDLKRLYDRVSKRSQMDEFYVFWRALALKLIESESLPIQLFGWEQVGDLIEASGNHRPPPRSFKVTNAGCPLVNGEYFYHGSVTEDGYAKPDKDLSYVRQIPEGQDGAGKKLTLFRCTMRSQQKWWFLSEADEEQPGTDRDIDYYQHKSKEHEEAYPPPEGWLTCRGTAGVDPPPNLEPRGILTPAGEELKTLEHQLAQWAIENKIVEQVLGDTTIHREVVARSTVLIKFLASMCDRRLPADVMTDETESKKYCLQSSHLLFAWKTCTRKADAAVSSQVYQLLVSVLPDCPSDLAIPLLRAVQTTLDESTGEKDHLPEVAEFCSLLASGSLTDVKANAGKTLRNDVRVEVLNLLWSILTHPEASTLKSYDTIRSYVTYELKIEPNGKEHRERFLRSCLASLAQNARATSVAESETQALRMVKLSDFVLHSCPRDHAIALVSNDEIGLPELLFQELKAFLTRKKLRSAAVEQASTASPVESAPVPEHLNDRLLVLRRVYGLVDPQEPTDRKTMTAEMVRDLWSLCDDAEDRDAMMVFIAEASYCSGPLSTDTRSHAPYDALAPALSQDVCLSVFIDQFCSPSFEYDKMSEGAYKSFRSLFKYMRSSAESTEESKDIALDALWRLCLSVEHDLVSRQSMRDLLGVYVADPTSIVSGDVSSDRDGSFGARMFEMLTQVKSDLQNATPGSLTRTRRCLLILTAAIGQQEHGQSAVVSTLVRLARLGSSVELDEALMCIPHGMLGQACYRSVGIVIRRPQTAGIGDGRSPPTPGTTRLALFVHPLETYLSLKRKIAEISQCSVAAVRLVQIIGGSSVRSGAAGESSQMNLSILPEDTVMEEIGISNGCELVFIAPDRQLQQPLASSSSMRGSFVNDLSDSFFAANTSFVDKLFSLLMDILDASSISTDESSDVFVLAWQFILAMPTNQAVASLVQGASRHDSPAAQGDDNMEVDSGSADSWKRLLDPAALNRSVYSLLVMDSFLQPAPECISLLPASRYSILEKDMESRAGHFRQRFISSGGFEAVAMFLSSCGSSEVTRAESRRGSAVALRILKTCLFGRGDNVTEAGTPINDSESLQLLSTLAGTQGLLQSLALIVVQDQGVSSTTAYDVLSILNHLFRVPDAARAFGSMQDNLADRFFVALLCWDAGAEILRSSSTISLATKVRRGARDLILGTPYIAGSALPWLIQAVGRMDFDAENTSDFFDVLDHLVCNPAPVGTPALPEQVLRDLGGTVCQRLASYPRPTGFDASESPSGVLCGCLRILRSVVEHGGGTVLRQGCDVLLGSVPSEKWSQRARSQTSLAQSLLESPSAPRVRAEDACMLDLMGAIFDGFLAPGDQSPVPLCVDKESRRSGFEVVSAALRACSGTAAYMCLVDRMNSLIHVASADLFHKWGLFGSAPDGHGRSSNQAKYSGLRNQGCTCYMNSVLQQMFMMPGLRDSLCSAPIPAHLRSSGGMVSSKGLSLVGKKIALQWETGASYEAFVEHFDEASGTHVIRYLPRVHGATSRNSEYPGHPDDPGELLPPCIPDQFVLTEGRPGKETGVFEVLQDPSSSAMEGVTDTESSEKSDSNGIRESQDEATSRHLLEEVQRTFIHLEEGSKGRCFDPRALVEACTCLKLEFDVWQQNDASEFATKFLDRLEIALKRWAPDRFRYLDHTFGIKQTKQKICKECNLKTNREEKLLNIDCQIRGKADIHEALESMTEVELMEGSNKVSCDNCKKKTDTILRTAISALPNVLILSLKRFDLDFTTFETVKINSRCAFGETLNMKKYTLQGIEESESKESTGEGDASPMDTDNPDSDEEFEYRLVGVLVHAGVAQGGHYYSFIKDRNQRSEANWYRFDDEDVTPFDPASIEAECFGGKIRKETKWPNGQAHVHEQDQFANALMLFYEKVHPSDPPSEEGDTEKDDSHTAHLSNISFSTGYDTFEPDVRHSNALHRWQSFLFDVELHAFMEAILEDSVSFAKSRDSVVPTSADEAWLGPVVDTLFSFFFDVLLYSSDPRPYQMEWPRKFEEILSADAKVAQSFCRSLARRVSMVNGNWLRTYLVDCPDLCSRRAAISIFTVAMRSCCSFPEEVERLEDWKKAWIGQTNEYEAQVRATNEMSPLPLHLGTRYASLEDAHKLESGEASCLAVIMSHVNTLLDATPFFPRFCVDPARMIRDLALDLRGVKSPFRAALIESNAAARLIALILRERAPRTLRLAFPRAAAPVDLARSSTGSQVLPMTNQMMNASSEPHAPRVPSASDFVVMFQALSALEGLPGSISMPIFRDLDEDSNSGRPRVTLTDTALSVLSVIFEESCWNGAPGMDQRDIDRYLRRCQVQNTSDGQPHRVVLELSKYKTLLDDSGGSLLALDGFLTYYRDLVQSGDMVRVKNDIFAFGVRGDLTFRSRQARYSINEEGIEVPRTRVESVALDVAETLMNEPVHVGRIASMAMYSMNLYGAAFNFCDMVAEYLVAACTYKKDATYLIDQALLTVFSAPHDWNGNENVASTVHLLSVVAATPGEEQASRISTIMQSKATLAREIGHGAGLLHVARALMNARTDFRGDDKLLQRYVDIVKHLRELSAVYEWMESHRDAWSFLDREMLESYQGPDADPASDFGFSDPINPQDQQSQTDSDMAGINESDDDSQFDHTTGGLDTSNLNKPNNGPHHLVVSGAGFADANGVYYQAGYFENACRYWKGDSHNGEPRTFFICKCNVSNNTMHWYLSITPQDCAPGTANDTDFYTAQVTTDSEFIPPRSGWSQTHEGVGPPPTIEYGDEPRDEAEPFDDDLMANGDGTIL